MLRAKKAHSNVLCLFNRLLLLLEAVKVYLGWRETSFFHQIHRERSPISLGTAWKIISFLAFFFFFKAFICPEDTDASWILADKLSIRKEHWTLGTRDAVQQLSLCWPWSPFYKCSYLSVATSQERWWVNRPIGELSRLPRVWDSLLQGPERRAYPGYWACLLAGWAVTVCWGIFIKIQRGCWRNQGI